MAHNTELTFEDLATNYSKPLLAYIDFLRKNKKVQFAEFDEDSIPVDGDELDGLVVDDAQPPPDATMASCFAIPRALILTPQKRSDSVPRTSIKPLPSR